MTETPTGTGDADGFGLGDDRIQPVELQTRCSSPTSTTR